MGMMVEVLLLPMSMVLVQLFTIGALFLSKIAVNIGMPPFILVTYRNLIAAITVMPFAIYFEREMIKKVNLKVFCWNTLSGLLGVVLAMGFHYYGLRATNAAYAVNFLNIIPVVTFVIAIILRMEKLMLGTCPGRMKVIGTLICVGGTMVISLYKGKLLHLWPSHLLNPSQMRAIGANESNSPSPHNMLIGTIFLSCSSLSYAFWFVTQVQVAKIFPSKYFSTMLSCLSGMVIAAVIGIAIDSDLSKWKLSGDLRLIAVVYLGVFNTGVTFCLVSFAVARRGPTYPSMFNSLALIITTILDSVLLGTDVSVGSLLGAILIILGLYAFLWGKGKETPQKAHATADRNEDRMNSGVDRDQDRDNAV